MKNKFTKNKKGFTLIELLIVIFIIATILTITTISFNKIKENSRNNQRVQDIQQLQLVLENYYQENNSYPNEIIFGEPLIKEGGEKIYLTKIPQNPNPKSDGICSNSEYNYKIKDDSYLIEFCLSKKTSEISAGYNCATPQGIRSGECFQCGTTVTYGDQDYNTILIGDQCWFQENINIGIRINTSNEQTDNSTIEKYCYDNLEENCNIYGGLYQWEEMMNYNTTTSQGICPLGWHISSDDDWLLLTAFLGGPDIAGAPLKSSSGDIITWDGNNFSNFTAIPGGYRLDSGSFEAKNNAAIFWTSTENISNTYWARGLGSGFSGIDRSNGNGLFGNSVRCVKD